MFESDDIFRDNVRSIFRLSFSIFSNQLMPTLASVLLLVGSFAWPQIISMSEMAVNR